MKEEFGNVLFVHNTFFQGRKEYGPTSNLETTWELSVRSFFGNNVTVFNPDVFGPDSDIESDKDLIRLIDETKPKLLIMIYHNGYLWKRNFISFETLTLIKNRGIVIIGIWGDLHVPDQRASLRQLAPYITLNLCSASEAAVSRLGLARYVQYIWVPILDIPNIDARTCTCGCMVSFAGSQKRKRAKTIKYLKQRKIQIHIGGGEGVGTLSRR